MHVVQPWGFEMVTVHDTQPAGVDLTADRRRVTVVAKVLFALLGFSALVTEVATLLAQDRLVLGNLLSFFTIESNALAVVSLLVSSFALAQGRSGPGLDFFRGAVTFCMTTTLLIFIVLLSGYPADQLTAVPWDNTVLHYLMPIAVIADWVFASRVGAIPLRRALVWLLLPLLYLVYSLIRGPIVDWYPYPFMNASERGYGAVAITAVVLAVVLALVALAVAVVSRWTPVGTRRR